MRKPPPVTKLSRGAVVGKTLLKIGATQTKGLLKRTLGSKQNTPAIQEQTHEEIADVIFEALGELKGVSVKIAQQIALGMPFLSPVYLEKIGKSFNAVPPLNRALIRKLVKQELGRYPNEVFESFESEAFAAASLGQVHRATFNGEEVAVKIQYPGIKQSIASDMSLLHFALKRFAKGQNVDHLITEIEERLYEETEYALEAENYRFFGEHLRMDRIVIPKVYPELSTDRVLTTELLEGKHFEAFLAQNPSQGEKDSYAQLILDGFFYSLYKIKRIHADPNPGNFLFMEGNKLGLIDFGCVKKVDPEFLARYTDLHHALLEGASDEEIVPLYVGFGMIKEESEANMLRFYREVIKPLDRLYIEPLLGESYDFKVNSDFSKKGFKAIFEVHAKQYHSVHQVNEEYLFLDRTLLGYYAMFEKMGAKIETGYVKQLIMEFRGRK